MPGTLPRHLIAAVAALLAAATVVLHACSDSSDPPEPTPPSKFHLILTAAGSIASGTLAANRGGVDCAVSYSAGQATTSGTCAADLDSSQVVAITATPLAGGAVTWTGCDAPLTDNPLVCQVTMSSDREIAAAFTAPPSSFELTVQGAANGNGNVASSPEPVACAISAGAAGGTCQGSFPAGASVTLTASAAAGSFVKAWSGAGCDTTGTGGGTMTGSCVVKMDESQVVVVSFATSADEYKVGSWSPPFAWPAVAIHAHLLPNGRVLTFGRMPNSGVPVLWDPANPGVFEGISEPGDLFCSGHSLLPDGKLLVSGGHAGMDLYGTKTTFIYDVSGGWAQGPDMQNGRWYPTNTTLASGEVLTISGTDTAALYNRIPEVWDNGTWRPLSSATSLCAAVSHDVCRARWPRVHGGPRPADGVAEHIRQRKLDQRPDEHPGHARLRLGGDVRRGEDPAGRRRGTHRDRGGDRHQCRGWRRVAHRWRRWRSRGGSSMPRSWPMARCW